VAVHWPCAVQHLSLCPHTAVSRESVFPFFLYRIASLELRTRHPTVGIASCARSFEILEVRCSFVWIHRCITFTRTKQFLRREKEDSRKVKTNLATWLAMRRTDRRRVRKIISIPPGKWRYLLWVE